MNCLLITPTGSFLVGAHPSTGRALRLPLGIDLRCGRELELPMRGSLFDIAARLGMVVPDK